MTNDFRSSSLCFLHGVPRSRMAPRWEPDVGSVTLRCGMAGDRSGNAGMRGIELVGRWSNNYDLCIEIIEKTWENGWKGWFHGIYSWWCIPSGEHTKSNGKSPFFMGKSTISMAIFHCYVSSPEGMIYGLKTMENHRKNIGKWMKRVISMGIYSWFMIAKLVNIKPNVTMVYDTQITILSWCL